MHWLSYKVKDKNMLHLLPQVIFMVLTVLMSLTCQNGVEIEKYYQIIKTL